MRAQKSASSHEATFRRSRAERERLPPQCVSYISQCVTRCTCNGGVKLRLKFGRKSRAERHGLRSRAELEAEILVLRQLINVLRRAGSRRRRFSLIDRLILGRAATRGLRNMAGIAPRLVLAASDIADVAGRKGHPYNFARRVWRAVVRQFCSVWSHVWAASDPRRALDWR